MTGINIVKQIETDSPSGSLGVADIYPMPSFVTLIVRDVAKSSAWYRDVLGFQIVMSFGAPNSAPTFAHLRWIKFADLLLQGGAPSVGEGSTIFFQTELDRLDVLAERARVQGSRLLCEPANRPWNTRDFTVADPDGYRLAFTAGPVNATLSMHDISNRIARSSINRQS